MCMFRLGIIGFGSMDSLASSKGRIPTVGLRHLRNRGELSLSSSESSSGMDLILKFLLFLVPESFEQHSYNIFPLLVFFRYFMREFFPLGAIEESHLPMYLTSWVDKTSPLCIYIVTHIRVWSTTHLKAGCWYIDCGKILCPAEEEDAKKACIQADSKGAALGPNQGDEQEDVVEVDISQLPEKEHNKILNQRIREAERAKEKADKEAKKAKEKANKEAQKAKEKIEKDAKKAGKSGKSKASTPPLLLKETSYASPLQNPRKRDASSTQLSLSRLQ
jgi:hypothetical protein